MSIKVFQDTDTNTVKYNDNMSIPNQNFKIVQSNDNLKSSRYNNNSSMRPKLNEDNHNPKENMLLNDINLLGNPKKTRGMSSSDEETENTYTSESEIMTEEDNTSMTGDADRLLGNNHINNGDENNFDPFNNDESSGSSEGSGEEDEGTNTTSRSGEETNASSSSKRRPPPRQKTLDEINQENRKCFIV